MNCTTRLQYESSTNYGNTIGEIEDLDTVLNQQTNTTKSSVDIEISSHADLRWVQRAHDFDRRLDYAWAEARPVDLKDREFDRVRYDNQSETLLCANGNTLITVLIANYETFSICSSPNEPTRDCLACGQTLDLTTATCTDCGFQFVKRHFCNAPSHDEL